MANALLDNYHNILSEIKTAAEGRPVRLMGVTKTVDVDRINTLIDAGLDLIGENRVQEFLSKYDLYHKENLEIHFIGHLQRNKVKYIIDKVDMIESVDSIALAQEIQRQACKHGLVMDVLIEINIGDEESKTGASMADFEALADFVTACDNLRLRGIMSILPICDNEEDLTRYFLQLNQTFVDIKAKNKDNSNDIDCLSMGMSSDYLTAVKCGSTQVRIGSSLFGTRKP